MSKNINVSQIGVDAASGAKPRPPTSLSPIVGSGGGREQNLKHNLIWCQSWSFSLSQKDLLAVEGLDTNLACLSWGLILCFLWEITAVHVTRF